MKSLRRPPLNGGAYHAFSLLKLMLFLRRQRWQKAGLAPPISARAERLKRHANMRFTIRCAGLGGQATKPEI